MGRGQVVLSVTVFVAVFACVSFSPSGTAALPVVVNEVLYDPAGSDTGLEFAELFNCSPEPLCLDGWVFETGNGAYPDRWTREWTGSNTDTIAARSFFVIGEDLVLPTPDFVTALDLQNGPDACRLTSPEGVRDVVGWGDLGHGEYYEGFPVTGGASGSSVGRDPDGADRNVNFDDFRVFEYPSPGDFNHPPFDLAVERAALSRHTPPSGADVEIACMLVNCGVDTCGGTTLTGEVAALKDSTYLPDVLQPSERLSAVVRLPHPGEGLHSVRVWHSHRLDRWHSNDTVWASIVLPPPPVVINEVMFKPVGTECEWIEIFAHGAAAVDLRDWTLEDYRGTGKSITADHLTLAPGDMLVLVEDEEVFGVAHPELGSDDFLRPCGGWPTLNDADGPLGFADMIVVRDAMGTMVDSVAYRSRWSRPGTSVERIDPRGPSPMSSNWSPHYGSTGGSPGRANSVSFYLSEGRRILSLSPAAFSPDGDGRDDLLAVSVKLAEPCVVRLTVFDLGGRPVKRLIDGEVVEVSRITFWDGSSTVRPEAAMGAYLVLLEARGTSSGNTYRAKSPAILIRR
jgi:hypothetical protein